VVLGPRADYRTMKMTGSATNKTIKQTKAAISIWSPSVWPRTEASRRRGLLPYKRGKVAQSSTAAPQDYWGVLHAEGGFAGLSWADAKQLAAPVSFDMCTRDDAEAFVRNRARHVLAGVDNMPWKPGGA
jgi:hypothetical protein